MTKTLGRIIEKEISSADICCRNVQFEIKLLNITHTWCNSVFDRSLNKAIRQKPSITQYELRKMPTKFHIPSLNKCQVVSLIFKNTEWLSQDGQKLLQFPLPENSFCKSGSVTKFPRNVFLFHSENIGISNWQLRSSIKSNS